MRIAAVVIAAAAVLAVASNANAAAPVLHNVAQQNRHATARFSAPGADFATIYLASKPDKASDGSFLEENVETLDALTIDEIQHGAWLDSQQIDPGLYYVMLRATDVDCVDNVACTRGFSNMMTLQVPKPRSIYRGKVAAIFRYSGILHLQLTVNPLGERLPYRVCWRLRNKSRKCVRRSVNGYSWNSPGTDSVSIAMRGMGRRTTFTWYVRGRAVSAKTASTARR